MLARVARDVQGCRILPNGHVVCMPCYVRHGAVLTLDECVNCLSPYAIYVKPFREGGRLCEAALLQPLGLLTVALAALLVVGVVVRQQSIA